MRVFNLTLTYVTIFGCASLLCLLSSSSASAVDVEHHHHEKRLSHIRGYHRRRDSASSSSKSGRSSSSSSDDNNGTTAAEVQRRRTRQQRRAQVDNTMDLDQTQALSYLEDIINARKKKKDKEGEEEKEKDKNKDKNKNKDKEEDNEPTDRSDESVEEEGVEVFVPKIQESSTCQQEERFNYIGCAFVAIDQDDDCYANFTNYPKCLCNNEGGCFRIFNNQLICDRDDNYKSLQCICNDNTDNRAFAPVVLPTTAISQNSTDTETSTGNNTETNTIDTEETEASGSTAPGGTDNSATGGSGSETITVTTEEPTEPAEVTEAVTQAVTAEPTEVVEQQGGDDDDDDDNGDDDDDDDDDESVVKVIEEQECMSREEALDYTLFLPDEGCDLETNTEDSCNDGCCRVYLWLICDRDNRYSFLPCVCNKHTTTNIMK